MPFVIRFLEDTRILETVYSDPLSLDELKAAARDNLAQAAEKGTYRLLADCTAMQSGGAIVNNYALGNYILSLRPDPKLREAVLLPASARVAGELKFFEDVAQNRGIQVRTFASREDAVRWLTD